MAGIRDWRIVGLCGLAVFSFGAMAQELPPGDTGPKWGPHIDAEAKLGNKRNLGEADLFLPISQDNRTLVFANLRGRFDDNASREGNFGLGVRRMRQDGWNLGAYGYFDRRRSDTGNFFNQGTLGVEALGRDLDFRANGYVPIGTRVRDLGETSSAALSGASVQLTTTDREERALKGFDAEAGWRLPLFDPEARRQFRLFLGGYRFSDDVLTVEGPRVRAELTMEELPWLGKGAGLFLGAEAQHDNTRGGQSFLSLRLRIPLGKESARPSTLNAQERRMAAPVMRDVDIVTQSRVASMLVETATQTAGGSAITVLDSATTAGAALPGAVTAAGANSTVILSGTFNTTATTTLQAGQTVMGGGSLTVKSASGRTAALSLPSATVAGGIGGGVNSSTFALANNSTLTGLTISNSGNAGAGIAAIYVNGISGVTLSNNTITGTESGANTGIGVALNNASNITISGNNISASAGATAEALVMIDSTATITGNTLSASHGANNYYAFFNTGGGNTTLTSSTGNVHSNGTCQNFAAGHITGSLSFTDLSTCP
ncbi:MAG TPA: inverse autotransporter beta domain-containing protein [Sulfuricella sp.]|nr:inverse autotransporter beta domain-containing protein [Sulfuricella sp.]